MKQFLEHLNATHLNATHFTQYTEQSTKNTARCTMHTTQGTRHTAQAEHPKGELLFSSVELVKKYQTLRWDPGSVIGVKRTIFLAQERS